MNRARDEGGRRWARGTVWFCVGFALFALIVPFARSFFRVEVDYNEGWNIYNATAVAQHQWLYPVKYGWTSVNYPMLSFFLMAQLHRVTHEYLFTARMVSLAALLGCSALVGTIVRRLGGGWFSAWLAGMFCLAMFCTNADAYVGMDDPQMLAQMFFLGGLWVYLRRRESLAAVAGAALLFVIGGFIKHNPIDFPLAVLVELMIVSRLRAGWFAVVGLLFTGAAVWLNVKLGGPYFISELLAPRVYLPGKVPGQFVDVFGPLLIPFCVAVWMAFTIRGDTQRRIITILFAATLVVGGYFGGGQGVSINCLFTAMLASAILIGLFVDAVSRARWRWTQLRWAGGVPAVLFVWLVIPMILSGNWNVPGKMRETAAAERRFDAAAALVRERPGPVICESLLLCNYAGKDYVYDPFNATRLIHFGKLDAEILVEGMRRGRYGAVQLDGPISGYGSSERFNPAIVKAVQENYVAAFSTEDAVIYVPKAAGAR